MYDRHCGLVCLPDCRMLCGVVCTAKERGKEGKGI